MYVSLKEEVVVILSAVVALWCAKVGTYYKKILDDRMPL